MSVEKEKPKGALALHVPELDGVRGIAIAAVMALHFLCSPVAEPHGFLERVTVRVTGYGLWGVDLFFVLSGYLITGILSDTKGSNHYFRAFYMRRTLRIFPLYYGVLFLLLVLLPERLLASYAPDLLAVRSIQGWLWPYLTNVYIAKQGSFSIPYVSHFWTLAIEEHFYLVWPFVVGLLRREIAMRVCVVAGLFALGLRIGFHYSSLNSLYEQVLTPCRLDTLCGGAWFALALRGPGGVDEFARRTKRWLGYFALGVFLTSLWHVASGLWDEVVSALRETLLALLFGSCIVVAAWQHGPVWVKRALRQPWLRWLGKYSYGLYVFHGIIAYAFGAHGVLPRLAGVVGSHSLALFLQAGVGVLLSALVSIVSYELYEVRFLGLKKWFQASRKPTLTDPARPSAG